jgi:hypothetical protein
VGTTEWVLLALVILVPLVIAAGVTLWSLEQVRYRPKRRRPRPAATDTGADGGASPPSA